MALPVSVGDMLKLLDKIPEWVGLKRMQARIDALEAKVAALEARHGAAVNPAAHRCPQCQGPLRFVSERPHPQFGVFGMKEHTLHCDTCGHDTTREFDPSKG